MADDLYPVLLKFHREVFLPDFTRIVQEAFGRIELHMKAMVDELDRRLDDYEMRDPLRPTVAPPANE